MNVHLASIAMLVQVNTWLSNYVSFKGDKDTRDFFKLMHKNVKPNERCTSMLS